MRTVPFFVIATLVTATFAVSVWFIVPLAVLTILSIALDAE